MAEWDDDKSVDGICCHCRKESKVVDLTIPPLRGFMPYCQVCVLKKENTRLKAELERTQKVCEDFADRFYIMEDRFGKFQDKWRKG